ncbi:polysaccharide biosynthesis tyrosine autokinase [Acidisoma cellulosilytica]|uniref:Polysaccharide biosynthesis tyrosine autokinase n=1 Tax=Acidisoma cellulosilyticum TaxID=2802395 RepID=A0A963Z361_9PROT|nr:polysaccharide biosynthesis tyrosine autokinase [Acidisoma cellulosilyticum]MCB8881751.1 polysaccharide biosynthesis tyrosine autokinase [Acidisoma cellulosilyticum]
MQDENFQRSPIEASQRHHVAARPVIDPTAAIEPIAVPFGRLGAVLRRRLWIIVLALIVGLGGAFLLVQRMPKQYTAQASLLISPQRTQVSDLQAISNDAEDTESLMRTQIDILSSPSLALGVVQALGLTKDPEFMPHAGGLSSLVQTWMVDLHIAKPVISPPLTQSDRELIASSILSGKMSFSNQVHSRLLGIAVTTLDPTVSARIANELAKQFLAFEVQEKYAAMQRAHDWLQGQIGSLAQEVQQKDNAVEAYRVAHGLAEASPSLQNNSGSAQEQTVNRQQLDATSTELVQVSRDLSEKEGELVQAQAALKGHMSPSDLPAVLASPVIAELVQESAVASARASELSSTLGAANPELRSARARAFTLQNQISTQMAAITRSIAVQVKAARDQKATLQAQLDQLRGAVGNENAAELGLNTLESQAQATRNLYESFLTRAAQLANVAGIQEADASLVSGAEPPLGPSSPKRTRILAVALMLAVAVGVGIAILLERLGGGFSRPEEIESVLGLPLLGMLPAVSRKRPVLRGGRGAAAEVAMTASLNRLRGQMRVLGDARPQLLMVTSSLPKEGKSVFSARLAQNMAAAGWRVLLLECDFCRPSLAGYLGLTEGPGLCEILSGLSIGNSDRMIRQPEANLDVILAGRVRSDSQELLASSRMQAMLADARNRYDLIILDTPPVLPIADALVLGQNVDATIAVVQWEKTPRDAVKDSIRLLRDSRIPVMGVMMTQVNQKKAVLAGGRMSYPFRHYEGYNTSRA